MDGVTIVSNQWNQLTQLSVNDVPLIYLLGLSASNWSNCKIDRYGENKLKEFVDKVINCRFTKK